MQVECRIDYNIRTNYYHLIINNNRKYFKYKEDADLFVNAFIEGFETRGLIVEQEQQKREQLFEPIRKAKLHQQLLGNR